MNVDFEMEMFTFANYKTQITIMQAAQEPFDLFFTNGGNYFTFARQGVLWELTDERLNKYARDAVEVLGEALLNANKVDGKLYALPANKDNASSMGLLLNKALVDKYNFDIDSIKTLDDLTPMLAVIKANEPNIVPYIPNATMDLMAYGNFTATSGNIAKLPGVVYMSNDPGNTKVLNQWETEECRNYVKLMHSWFKNGYISADDTTGVAKAGRNFANIQKLKPGKDKEQSNENVTWIQKDLTAVDVDITDIAGSVTAISKTSENPEICLQVLNLAYKDPVFVNMIVFGIENKHYMKVSDNVVEIIPDSGYPNNGNGWRFGNQFLNYLKVGEDPDKWEQIRKFNESALVLDVAGFYFDSSDYMAEVAALTNVADQYWTILYNGQADPDVYLPEFIDKLKANGSDRFIQAQQEQLDAFLASKKK